LPNKHDDIEGVRIIRDPETLVGKGIGYLLLKDRDAVLKALSLHQVFASYNSVSLIILFVHFNQELFKKRWSLRVTICGKRTKRTERVKSVVAEAKPELKVVDGVQVEYNRSKMLSALPVKEGTNNKRKLDNVDFALKRIKLKVINHERKYFVVFYFIFTDYHDKK
jgi:hypothetical protein